MVVLATAALSFVLCGAYLHIARRREILDRPNHRSSHVQATPHGGGAPLLLAFCLGLGIYLLPVGEGAVQYLICAALAVALMVFGILDDTRGLSVVLRLSLYALVCLLALLVLWGDLAGLAQPLALLCFTLLAGSLLWLVNLYNFMDGIDGIAAIQAVLACAGAAIISADMGDIYAVVCLLFAAAHCGFLAWNWPPARLFMGDAGSIPSGFMLGALALIGWREDVINPLCWLVLLALFIVDATYTLLARLWRGERVSQGHRQHAYQRLSRYWGSHLRVDLLLIAVTLLWLLPIAWLVQQYPQRGFFLVILAYLPWVICMAKFRAIK